MPPNVIATDVLATNVIVIAGVSGSGKTTLAKNIAEKNAYRFIEADDFHSQSAIEKMSRNIPLNDADRRPWLLSLNKALAESQEQSQHHSNQPVQQPVVLACSALKKEYRAILGDGLTVLYFWLNISPALAASRIKGRENHFMPASLLNSQFEIADPPDDAIIVDASLSPSTQLNFCLEHLPVN